MTARAFIIAIETYDALPKLDGVNAAANSFYKWLVEKKNVKPDSIFGCADKNQCAWATNGTSSNAIIGELYNLWLKIKQWTDAGDPTTEFFFFYSGHGFANTKTSNYKPVDHLVASEFADPIRDGRACLEFYKIKESLWRSLGPSDHYYFIDACRNTNNDVQPEGTGFNPPQAANGATGAAFWLFSTAKEELAARDSGFAQALVDGLNGAGTAVDWYKNKLWVIFTDLYDYVDQRIQQLGSQQVDSDQQGKGRGLILQVKPIPKYKCEVIVDNASPQDEFTLTVSDGIEPKEYKFKGSSYIFSRPPKYYDLTLSHPTASVAQKEPPLSEDGLGVYDNVIIRFEKEISPVIVNPPVDSTPRSLFRDVNVMLTALPDDEIHFENLGSGEVQIVAGTFSSDVKPGNYLLKLRQNGVTVGRKKLNVKSGRPIKLNLHDPELNLVGHAASLIRDRLVDAIAGKDDPQLVQLSESLGPLVNWDLSLLLSVLGASHIVAAPNDYPKLSQMPLASFDKIKDGDSVIYVLAGFENSKGIFGVGISDDAVVSWQKMSKVETLTGVYEKLIPAVEGSHLLSIKLPEQLPITYAIYCLPNRATFIVFTEDTNRRLTLHQYILPIRTLFGYLESSVLDYLRSKPLDVVRLMFLAQIQFARKRPLLSEDGRPIQNAYNLLNGKWLDPIMSLIGAYELIRQGVLEKDPNRLNRMLKNLRRYFAGLPDTEAIAKVVGQHWSMPKGAPLLLDSVLAFDEMQERNILPLAHNQVDYGSAWTSWRGMVNDFK